VNPLGSAAVMSWMTTTVLVGFPLEIFRLR
jgi:hypothetical protein